MCLRLCCVFAFMRASRCLIWRKTTAWIRVKSTKLSNISTTLPKPPTFFLDRTFGADLSASELRSWEWPVEAHRKWFKHSTEDDEWIAKVSEKRWKILTSDQDLEFRYHEEIVAAKAGIFVLSDLKEGEGYQKW